MGTKSKRETQRIPFTKRRLEALEFPVSGRVYVHDERCPGLALCLTESGSRTFYYYRWAQGRPQRKKLGRFPGELTVEQARDLAKTWAGKFAAGEDPIEAVRASRRQPTLGGAWKNFERYGLEHKRPKSRADDKRYWESFLKPWAGRRLAAITRAEVQVLHSKVGKENGPYRANRLLALLSTIYNRASVDLDYSGGNPARGVKRFKEQSRDRFLHPDELKPFFAALMAEENETLRDFFIVALMTGARRSNCEAMAWADIDLQGGYWRIPPEQSKGGTAVIIPLSPVVHDLLKRRRKATKGSEWVFPSRSKTGHVTEPKSAWQRIIKAAGLSDVRPHDLRRTLGSWQALLGASETLIGKTLGHAPGSPATSVYARLSLDPVRQSVNGVESALLTAAKRTPDLLPMPEEPDHEVGPDGNA